MKQRFEKQHFEKVKGGLYGLLIGDALGVPYEFHAAEEIPSYGEIEMTPPSGFYRAHASVKAGTWSDDGAQALCLLDSLISCGAFCLNDFSDRLLAWHRDGMWAVDGVVFDIGIQTSEALTAYHAGMSPEECGMMRSDGKGNGALMRVLPLALWHSGTDAELVQDAHAQCLITHGHLCNQVCCALYCLTALALLEGQDARGAVQEGVRRLRLVYSTLPEYEQELEWSVRPDLPWKGEGTGYVVSAFMVLLQTDSYEEAVKQAVLLGNDTDTTACVAGGLAGILYGFEGSPKRWLLALRERERAEELLKRLLT